MWVDCIFINTQFLSKVFLANLAIPLQLTLIFFLSLLSLAQGKDERPSFSLLLFQLSEISEFDV